MYWPLFSPMMQHSGRHQCDTWFSAIHFHLKNNATQSNSNPTQTCQWYLCSHHWAYWTYPPQVSSKIQHHLDVEDSTPSWHWILSFGIDESWPNIFLDVVNLHLIVFKAWWILNECICFIVLLLFYLKVNLDLEKTNHVGESSPNFIFVVVNLDPIVLEERWNDGESWPNNFVVKVNRGEDSKWVGSRCPLMSAIVTLRMMHVGNCCTLDAPVDSYLYSHVSL